LVEGDGARCPIKGLLFLMFAWIAANSYMLSVELPLMTTSFFATNAHLENRQGQSLLNLPMMWQNKRETLLNFKISPTIRRIIFKILLALHIALETQV
jgi:hypothetical protein